MLLPTRRYSQRNLIRRLRQRRCRIAATDFTANQQIAGWTLRMQNRRIGRLSYCRVKQSRQRLILDPYRCHSRRQNFFTLRHQQGHRIAVMPHPFVSQYRLVFFKDSQPVAALDIFVRQHGDHAGDCQRRLRVDRQDARMRMFRPFHASPQQVRRIKVCGKHRRPRHFICCVKPGRAAADFPDDAGLGPITA